MDMKVAPRDVAQAFLPAASTFVSTFGTLVHPLGGVKWGFPATPAPGRQTRLFGVTFV